MMLLSHPKLPTGGTVLLLALLLCACVRQGASLPRHHRFRGEESEDRRPETSYLPPSSDMVKALEYIESLKQRGQDGAREKPTTDHDQVDKFRVLLQLASLQDQGAAPPERQAPPPPAQRQQDIPAEQLVRALLRTLQEQSGRDSLKPAPPPVPGNDRRAHRHHSAPPAIPVSVAGESFPRPHKKYPLMFEDEENRDAYKRATEDLDEAQYTPQSLANLRSIFEELGRMSSTTNGLQKRGIFDDDDDEDDMDMFNLGNLAYEDVAGGEEEWIPVEEKVETEEVVNGSHEEFDRGLGEEDNYDEDYEEEEEEAGDAGMQRRGAATSQDKEDPPEDDQTKLVDFYLLKILEMSDHQTQKRDSRAGEQRKRLIRHSLIDPRAVNELLEISLKLHIPPEDLIDMLITEEYRKLQPQAPSSARYRTSKPPPNRVRYYSRRMPVKNAPHQDMDREDFLNIIGVETISNEYPVRQQRPFKGASAPARVAAPPGSAPAGVPPAAPPAAPVKVPSASSGRRENLFLSELNKMPLKKKRHVADYDSDTVDEDELATFLAAKMLTQYPASTNTIAKRDTQAQMMNTGQFPYELYEQAVKDYFDQVVEDTEKGAPAKRETDSETGQDEMMVEPTERQLKDEITVETTAPQTAGEEEKEHHGKPVGGM